MLTYRNENFRNKKLLLLWESYEFITHWCLEGAVIKKVANTQAFVILYLRIFTSGCNRLYVAQALAIDEQLQHLCPTYYWIGWGSEYPTCNGNEACNVIEKEALAQLFSCEFGGVFKNTFWQVTASGKCC